MKKSDTEQGELDLAGASEAGADLVRRLEESFDVNSLRYHGLKIWPRLRSQLVFSYMQGFYDEDAPVPRAVRVRGAVDRIAKLSGDTVERARQSAHDLEAAARVNAGRPLAFLGSNPKQVRFENRVWNPLFDPLIALVANDARPFARMQVGSSNVPNGGRQAGEAMIVDYDDMLAFMAGVEAARVFFDPPEHTQPRIAGFEPFRTALPSSLAGKLSEGAMVKDIAFIERLATYFRIYLEKAKPPFVMFSGQRRVNMAMTLATRRLGIPTVDIQHGAASYSPTGYKWHSWLQLPDEGYELLPDYFWVWGERPAAMVSRGANPNCRYHKPIVGGHPSFMADYGDDFSERFLSKISAGRQVVLATLGHIGKEGFPDNLLEAMKMAPAGWFWLLRLHPNDVADAAVGNALRARLDTAGVKNFEIDISSTEPLPKLLRHVQRHVTPYSSSAVEATAVGIPTLFIHPLAQELFGHILSLPGMQFAEEPEKIVAKLAQPVRKVEPLVEADRKKATWMLERLANRKSPYPYDPLSATLGRRFRAGRSK